MPSVPKELEFSPWRKAAWEAFRGEFGDDEEAFFKRFNQTAPVVYYELARRVIRKTVFLNGTVMSTPDDVVIEDADIDTAIGDATDSLAYALMDRAYQADATNNDSRELEKLLQRYRDLK